MGFLKSLSTITETVKTGQELYSVGSGVSSGMKSSSKPGNKSAVADDYSDMFPERIEKLIRLVLCEGTLDEDSREMLERAALKEGVDPMEVIFVTKKRLKTAGAQAAPVAVSCTKALAQSLAEIDAKFDEAIEKIRQGDTPGLSALDAITGGATGLAVSIGKSIFGKSDDDKVYELEDMRDDQRARIITATTLPSELLQIIELLEYVNVQVKADHYVAEEQAWKSLHETVYNRAVLMVGDNMEQKAYIDSLQPVKKLKKKLFGLF